MIDDQEYDELTRAIEHAELWFAAKYQVRASVQLAEETWLLFAPIGPTWRLCYRVPRIDKRPLVEAPVLIRICASEHLAALEEALEKTQDAHAHGLREATDRYLRFAQRKGDL